MRIALIPLSCMTVLAISLETETYSQDATLLTAQDTWLLGDRPTVVSGSQSEIGVSTDDPRIVSSMGLDNITASDADVYQRWLWEPGVFSGSASNLAEEYCFGPLTGRNHHVPLQ